jgi:glucokinase
MSGEPILVADIGGTNARLAIARVVGGGVTLDRILLRKSRSFRRVSALAAEYAAEIGNLPPVACLAIAGPVSGGSGKVTNADLVADTEELRRDLGFNRAFLINDFTALANAVPHLTPNEVTMVKLGEAMGGRPISVMGAGTGFGCALLAPCGGHYELVATEVGHSSFAPTDELELKVWQWLRERLGRVSVESVLSGAGLALLYQALREFDGVKETRSPREISREAAEGPDSSSARAFELFCNIFGGVAGDIVLTQGAAGGVYLGGGVLMKNAAALMRSRFSERFSAKGVMAPYMERIPVYLIRSEYAALKGAALWAAAHSG